VLELVCRHDNNLPVTVYLDPSNLHTGGLRGTECPCHVGLSEYCGGSGHGQEKKLSTLVVGGEDRIVPRIPCLDTVQLGT
jgi:hypothetical protein